MFYHRKRLLLLLLAALAVILAPKLLKRSREEPAVDEFRVGKRLKSNGRQTEYIDKNGMHVVVGRYVGDSLANPRKDPNLTTEELNANNYWVSFFLINSRTFPSKSRTFNSK